MRSIRLSLIAYFLGLLVVALGVASWLVHNSARATLRDKQDAAEELIKARFHKQVADEEKQLDDRLLKEAFALVKQARLELHGARVMYSKTRKFHVLGYLSAVQAPMGHLTAAPWLLQWAQDPRGWSHNLAPFPLELWRRTMATVSLAEGDWVVPKDQEPLELYYQIDTNNWGAPLRSASLRALSFPAPEGFGDGQPVYWEADTYELAPDKMVRRVRVKAANGPRAKMPRWGSPPGGRGGPTRRPRYEPPPLFITLQVGADLAVLERSKKELVAKRDGELLTLHQETEDALAQLRARLLLIAAVTFAATALGTWALVWVGLWPLKNLSEAVSKVTTRDFHLPVDRELLPAELQPITEKLTAALEQLKRAFAREKQATADISHELRTPLAALLTTIELALRKPRTPEKYREMFSDCHHSAKYLHQIVERLLTLARLDAGVDRCKPQPVDVAQVAEQCAAVVRPLAEAQGLTLTVNSGVAGEGEARTTTDPDKLREVLNNLLHNAIQYNRPNGQIDVRVARENGHVRVEVADTGIGIPAESRERIFERFYRADPSRNNGDGLHAGLGLAIVKEYIEVMGGHIEVHSQEGEGTVFRVALPVSR